MHFVRRIGDPRTVNQPGAAISASSPRAAARASGLATPGAQLIVTSGGATVRYQVDAAGRLRELSEYQT